MKKILYRHVQNGRVSSLLTLILPHIDLDFNPKLLLPSSWSQPRLKLISRQNHFNFSPTSSQPHPWFQLKLTLTSSQADFEKLTLISTQTYFDFFSNWSQPEDRQFFTSTHILTFTSVCIDLRQCKFIPTSYDVALNFLRRDCMPFLWRVQSHFWERAFIIPHNFVPKKLDDIPYLLQN